MFELNKSRLTELLKGKLPGKQAQYKMAPESREMHPVDKSCRDAAVLLLLYYEGEHLRIAFIKRNEYEGPHSAQISFPGGMKEKSDKDFADTALRETEEEIGIASDKIEILGSLTPLYIQVSNFCVHPYVGWINFKPEFNIDKTEVQYLICPLLDDFLDQKNIKHGSIDHSFGKISTPYFHVENEVIWGATAMILKEFTSLIGW
jgi:8-oxo-dGTP pyrophosphatase MutT (NUDIX family)